LWPLDCFVARAPRNDGWVAADPIASVVIGRRLTPSFCAISSRSYPATTNSQTVSRHAALAGRCFCARARRRPPSGWESSRTSLVVTPRLRRPAGTERAYPKTVPSLPFFRKRYRQKFLYGASLRVRTGLRPLPLDETGDATHLPPQRHGRAYPKTIMAARRFKYQDIPHGDVVMYISIIPLKSCRRNHAATKETICKDCEKLKKKIAFWRDLAGRYNASIDAVYGRPREARIARAGRTKPVHNSRILTKRLLADAARARKNPRGRARTGSFHITFLCESSPRLASLAANAFGR
jgi:hypothetical protein